MKKIIMMAAVAVMMTALAGTTNTVSVLDCESKVFDLTFASADNVARELNRLLGSFVAADGSSRPVASAFTDANSVAVYAPAAMVEEAGKIIARIDRRSRQVYVEARFVELSNSAEYKLGIHWDMLRAMSGTAGLGGGIGIQTLPDGLTEYERKKGGPQSTESESYKLSKGGRVDTSYFNGVLSFSEMSVVLSAFEGATDAKTFSNPRVIVSSGSEAVVDMTTKRPNVIVSAKRVVNGNNNTLDVDMKLSEIPGRDTLMFANEAFFSWGIMLKVRPRVTTNGVIHVEIIPTLSSLEDYVTAEGLAEDNQVPTARFPVLNLQRILTEFDLKSGDTAVIGGLSRTQEEDVDTGIPYLCDIPWIGNKLFGYKARQKVQKEIVVFVTVGEADTESMKKDAGLPKNAVLGRKYITGERIEPGDSTNSVEGVSSLDLRSQEERAKSTAK